MNEAQVLLCVRLSQEQIDAFKGRFDALNEKQRGVSIMLAHGIHFRKIAERMEISVADFYRRRNEAIEIMQCTSEELPMAIFSSLGVLIPHKM